MAVAILELINIQTLTEMAGWNPSIQAASICMFILVLTKKDSMHVHNIHHSFHYFLFCHHALTLCITTFI